jgi:hypothetical protein
MKRITRCLIRRREFVFAVATLLISGVAAACGSAEGAGTPTPTTAPSATAKPSPTVSGVFSVPQLNLSNFPSQDTAWGQLSSAQQSAWNSVVTQGLALNGTPQQFSRVVVPGVNLFGNMPQLPHVVNDTNGALNGAQAANLIQAFWYEQLLYQWGGQHGQGWLVDSVDTGDTVASQLRGVLSKGGTFNDPNCDVYPTVATVVANSPATIAWFGDNGGTSAGAYDIVAQVPGGTGCQITETLNGQTTAYGEPTPAESVSMGGGSVAGSGPLTGVYIADAFAVCGANEPHEIASFCSG